MKAGAIKLLHIAPRARGVGGIESLLARHAEWDGVAGFDAAQIGLFDRRDRSAERFQAMAFGGGDTPRAMRRELHQAVRGYAGRVVVWHNAWGLPWFAELDGAARRIVCLHAHRSYFESWLPSVRRYIDGILAVSPGIARDAAELLPGWPAERLACLPLPIAPPEKLELTRPEREVWVIGCAGRLARPQKRWDRLVPCVAELRRLGLRFRLEIIGDGPLRPWLERRFRGDRAVSFLGFVDDAEYWRRMQSWDAALFFSEVEGGPIVLLEAMAAGVLPVYPAIGGSTGDDYAPQIDPRCYYAAGDPLAAARNLHALLALPRAELTAKRALARALAQPHTAGAYEARFAEFVPRIVALPRISEAGTARRRLWADTLPLGLITRVLPGHLWR
jgi:glycosyltransferase involved in cell wall biosynthesis